MKLLLAAAVCLPCFASTIYPPLPPITEGQNVGYVTHGDADGILWTAGWFPDGADQSVWAVGFSAPVSSYLLELAYQFPVADQFGVSGNFYPLNGGTVNSQWLSNRVLQVYGQAPDTETMNIFLGAEPGSISFQALVDPPADAPEPGTIWLVVLPVAALYTSARRRRIGLLHADVYERP